MAVPGYSELRHTWGLTPSFADRMAPALAEMERAGLSPRVTSGYRSPERQRQLIQQAAAGAAGVFTPAPVSKSKHVRQDARGLPAAEALDVVTSDPVRAGEIAQRFGIEAGVFYRTPDPVHFESRDGPVKKALPLLILATAAAAGWWLTQRK